MGSLFDFDNFSFEDIVKMPLTQLETDGKFLKDLVTNPKDAFGNHQDEMTKMQGSLGLNMDNKIVKNSDAIVGSIFGAILAAPAIAGAAGGAAGGAGGAAAGATGASSAAATGSAFGMAANPFSVAASGSGLSFGTAGMGTGFGSAGFGMSMVNPLSVAGTEGALVAGSLGSAGGATTTTGLLGSGTEALGSDLMTNSILDGVQQFGKNIQQQEKKTYTPATIQDAAALGYGSDPSSRQSASSGILGDVMRSYQGVLSQY